jgi:signal peptidase I
MRVLAIVLSLIVPGAGHVLRGAFRRGIAWAGGLIALTLAMLFLLPNSVVTLAVVIVSGLLGRVACAIDAALVETARPRWTIAVMATGGFVAAVMLFGFVVDTPLRAYYKANYQEAYTISSASMAPALLVGDYVIVDKAVYRSRPPGRGDVIVFKYPVDERRDFIKRIVGMPGDQIHVRGRQVIVNGVPLSEPYLMPADGASRGAEERCGYTYGCDPILVPPNAYFLMGDNREHSQDSRNWGFILGGSRPCTSRGMATVTGCDGSESAGACDGPSGFGRRGSDRGQLRDEHWHWPEPGVHAGPEAVADPACLVAPVHRSRGLRVRVAGRRRCRRERLQGRPDGV